jgi:hypothetical protein
MSLASADAKLSDTPLHYGLAAMFLGKTAQ